VERRRRRYSNHDVHPISSFRYALVRPALATADIALVDIPWPAPGTGNTGSPCRYFAPVVANGHPCFILSRRILRRAGLAYIRFLGGLNGNAHRATIFSISIDRRTSALHVASNLAAPGTFDGILLMAFLAVLLRRSGLAIAPNGTEVGRSLITGYAWPLRDVATSRLSIIRKMKTY